jgi:hypothetical protein
MKVVKDFPPNYNEIADVFNIKDKKGIVFTYGDTIYCPFKKGKIPEHLKVHEKVHMRQQGNDPASWWKRYLVDEEFRLRQEVEAYRKQYKFFKSRNHDLEEQKGFLEKIASDLSGEIYGNVISKEEAKKEICDRKL